MLNWLDGFLDLILPPRICSPAFLLPAAGLLIRFYWPGAGVWVSRIRQPPPPAHPASASVLVVVFCCFSVTALVYLLLCVGFRFGLPALVLYYNWVETLFLAQFQFPLMHVSLQCFVVTIERDFSVAVMVVRFSNDNIIHAQYHRIQEDMGVRKVHIYEFSWLNMVYTLLSKRKLLWFVERLMDGMMLVFQQSKELFVEVYKLKH